MENPSTSHRAEHVRALVLELLGLAPEARSAHLDRACRDDPDLRRAVETFLAVHDSGHAPDRIFPPPADGTEVHSDVLVGRTVSHYRIVAYLGGGGMGAVYEALDTSLDRTVALKFLPAEWSSDEQARQRFVHEAKAASALDHPNICTIFEIGSTGSTSGEPGAGRLFIAMARYAGETLQTKIDRGPLSLDEALDYTVQMADGLAAAHAAGIVHRDVKPANVMVVPASAESDTPGRVKLLDFGLAKVASQTHLTRSGATLGTVAYMSPEQARGEAVDHRSDIWSLGVVLYEMVTGQRPFRGDYEQAILYSILNEEPEGLTGLRTGVPLALEEVVLKCLAKDPSARYQHVNEIPVDLRAIGTRPRTSAGRPVSGSVGVDQARDGRQRWARWSLAGLLTVCITLFVGIALWRLLPAAPSTELHPMRFPLLLSEGRTLGWPGSPLALSRDGSQIVYVAGRGDTTQLFLRALDQFEARPIPGTIGATNPFFSPDGQWIGFFSDDALKKVALSGGAPQFVCAATSSRDHSTVSGSWSSDGTIVFSQYSAEKAQASLWRVAASGGMPELVAEPPQNATFESYLWPQTLPDNDRILYTISSMTGDARMAILSLPGGEEQTLIGEGSHARYVSTGHLVFALAGDLLAVPFDLSEQRVIGTALPVVEGVMSSSYQDATFSVSDNGSLAYIPAGVNRIERTLAWIDHHGAIEPLSIPTSHDTYTPRLAPDGRRVIFQQRPEARLWLYDLERETLGRLTVEERPEWWFLWTVDGRDVIFNTTGPGDQVVNLYKKPADGSGPEERLTQSDYNQAPQSMTADGTRLAYIEARPDSTTGFDIWILALEGDRTPHPFLQTPANEMHPSFSPDGRWIAYASDKSGQWEVYVRPYPNTGGVTQISSGGGSEPLWSPDGRTLYYRIPSGNQYAERMMAVEIRTSPVLRNEQALQASKPHPLFEGPFFQCSGWGRSYDLSPDGDRFLMVLDRRPESAPTQFNVVVNWFEELNRLVSVAR